MNMAQINCRTVGVYNWLVLTASLLMAGCAQQYVTGLSTDELIELAGQSDQADRWRLAVIDEVLTRPLHPQQKQHLGRQLSRIVGSSLHSPAIRQRVVTVIFDYYPDNAPQWLGAALSKTHEPQIRNRIIANLVELNDKRALPGLIIALASELNTHNLQASSVGNALTQIAGEPIEQVLSAQLAQADNLQARIASIQCLEIYLGKEKTISLVLALPSEDDFIEMLQFWAQSFAYLPSKSSTILTSQIQRLLLSQSQKAQLQQRVKILTQQQSYRFDVRDSYLLLGAPQALLTGPCRQLTGHITRQLAKLGHTKRPASYKGGPDDYREDFVDQRNLLNYTDLVRIKLLLHSLSEPSSAAQLKRFLQEDFADIETEVGGLCYLDEQNRVVFQAYTPGRRRGDNQFDESPQMIEDAAFCLARWHCHADSWRGPELAGPGVDDLNYAAYHNCPLVVITHVNDKICNVDYCTPEGVVIDLGNY